MLLAMSALIAGVLGLVAKPLKLLLELSQLVIGKIFKIEKFIARAPDGANELIQLQLHGLGVAVLCVLNKKHHQERDDRGGCIDDKLPGVRKMERRPGEHPDQNDQHSPDKSPRLPRTIEDVGRRREKRLGSPQKSFAGRWVCVIS